MTYYSTSIGSAYGKIVAGVLTITNAGTAQRITATSTPVGGVWVAPSLGTGIVIAVGDSGVAATSGSEKGIILVPGNPSIFVPVNNVNLLYFDAASNNGKVSYAYLQPLSGALE